MRQFKGRLRVAAPDFFRPNPIVLTQAVKSRAAYAIGSSRDRYLPKGFFQALQKCRFFCVIPGMMLQYGRRNGLLPVPKR